MLTTATVFCLGCCLVCLVCSFYSVYVTRISYKTAIDEVNTYFNKLEGLEKKYIEFRTNYTAEMAVRLSERCSSCEDKSNSLDD